MLSRQEMLPCVEGCDGERDGARGLYSSSFAGDVDAHGPGLRLIKQSPPHRLVTKRSGITVLQPLFQSPTLELRPCFGLSMEGEEAG